MDGQQFGKRPFLCPPSIKPLILQGALTTLNRWPNALTVHCLPQMMLAPLRSSSSFPILHQATATAVSWASFSFLFKQRGQNNEQYSMFFDIIFANLSPFEKKTFPFQFVLHCTTYMHHKWIISLMCKHSAFFAVRKWCRHFRAGTAACRVCLDNTDPYK